MTRLAKRLSALVLVAVLAATTSASAVAENRHPACEAKQHDCGQAAKIASCCCGDLGTPSDAGTPAQARTNLASGVAAAPLPPRLQEPLPATDARTATQISPPRLALLDLTTLFACLLI